MCVSHEIPHYYDKEVQFVILLNLRHLDNTTVFSCAKRVILKRQGSMSIYDRVVQSPEVETLTLYSNIMTS